MYYRRPDAIKNYTYTVTSAPSSPLMDLSLIKEHLRLDPSDTSQDSYLTLLGDSAFRYAEHFTKRVFLTTTFETFRDSFHWDCFVLRRSPLQSVDKIEYLDSGSFTELNTDRYYNTSETDYSKILRVPGKTWPTINFWYLEDKLQSIKITFKAGYGDNFTDIPEELRVAMLQHVAALYELRGDCGLSGTNEQALPMQARMLYGSYRIKDVTGARDCV